jgi:hypothetical protein
MITGPKKRLLLGAALLAALAALAVVYKLWVRPDMTDFGVCYKAGSRILAGATLYTSADGHLQYKYSPPAALFFAPLALLPKAAAQGIWFGLSLLFLFFIFKLTVGLLPSRRAAVAPLVLLSILVMAKDIGRELELGQVNLLILLALVLSARLMTEGRDVPAGLLWGFSLFFKPYALVLLPYFLIKKKFKIPAVGLALFAAGLLLPVPFYGLSGGLELVLEWGRSLLKSTPVLYTVQANASLYAFFLKVLPGEPAAAARALLAASCLILAAVILALMRAGKRSKLPRPETLEVFFLLILVPMLSPLGWYYNYLYALPAVVLLLNDFSAIPKGLRWALAVNFVVIAAAPMGALGGAVYRVYMNYALAAVNFLSVLACLAVLRARRAA